MLRSWGGLALVAALLAVPCSPPAAGGSSPAAATRSISIENMQFAPANISVHRGDRIVWSNKDLFPHTVTAANGQFDSGSIAAGGTWTYVAVHSGEFSYACIFHPTMKGALQVQ